MVRPKSWHDAQGFDKAEDVGVADPPPSPSKGILMTPGTAAAKRKTVSFGDQIVQNESRRPRKSGLPDDCPGKFPSPWVPPARESVDTGDGKAAGQFKERNRLTEALEQARDESARRKTRSTRPVKPQVSTITGSDLPEPQADSAQYWKQEYDIYRENTMREVKKLVAKQKAAKNFARDKDTECLELTEQLQQEHKKATLLEKRTAELEAQLKEFQDQLHQSQAEQQSAKGELTRFKLQGCSTCGARPTFAEQIDAARVERKERRTPANSRNIQLRGPSDTQSTLQPEEKVTGVFSSETARTSASPEQPNGIDQPRLRPRNVRNPGSDRQRIPPVSSSTISQPGLSSKPTQEAPDPDSLPLKSLSINATVQDTRAVALSMGPQPPTPTHESPQDPGLQAFPPSSSSEPPIRASEQTLVEPQRRKADTWLEPTPSSPFPPDADTDPPLPVRSVSPVAARSAARTAAVARSADVKENVAPGYKPRGEQRQRQETEIPATTANGKRMVRKDGQEVGADRIAAAKARILARGRQIS